MEYIIETKNLTKKYDCCTVADNINLHIPKGKIYALLGRNGAGKTTTMKMLLNLIKATSGSIKLFGIDPTKETLIYHKVGSIIETPGFYNNLTAFENLQLLQCLRNKNDNNKIFEALKVVGLEKEKNKLFANYSLGMKQRLGIASAIVHEPELLILDEPINGLDPIGISEVRSFLYKLSHDKGITILISSHVLSEIELIADIIGIMHEGHLIEEINMADLHKRKRKYIQCDVSDVKSATELLKSYYQIKEYTIQENTLRIFDCTHDCGQINKLLVENNITVTKICMNEESLENYFSELIGGGGIA